MARSPRPANRRGRIVAAAALASLLAAAPAQAQRRADDNGAADRHDRCVALAQSNPKEGVARAKLWREQGGGLAADHCEAMALFGLKDYRAAAMRFEELASAMMAAPGARRAQVLGQAGEAWLAADEPARARADFDAALELGGEDTDLLIDRARALAGEERYREAIGDLDRAIALAPKRADAYIYRGSAYRSLGQLDRALADVERGLTLAPDDVSALLERGNIRRLTGNTDGARQDWRRIARLAPNSAAAAAAEVNLDRLRSGGREGPAGGGKP